MRRKELLIYFYLLFIFVIFEMEPVKGTEVNLSSRLSGSCYALKGQVNIGVIYGFTNAIVKQETNMICDDILTDINKLGHFAGILYSVEVINNRSDILPNITLGFLVLDDCTDDRAALGRALQVIPEDDTVADDIQIGRTHNCSTILQQRHVDVMLGPGSSSRTINVASIFSFYHIPQLSPFATSDELSDRNRFEYFLRLVPPDRYQARALLDFVIVYGWEYFILIHSEGSYGESGAKNVEKYAKELDLCLAWSYRMPTEQTESDDEYILKNLRRYKNARAAVLFASPSVILRLFAIVKGTELEGNFVWIASDYFAFDQYNGMGEGTFGLHFIYKPFPGSFLRYVSSLTPFKDPNNSWVQGLLKRQFNCTWNFDDGFIPCQNVLEKLSLSSSLTYYMNGMMTLAQSLHNTVNKFCPEEFNGVKNIRKCLKGSRILHSLKTGKFEGIDEHIEFDDNSDHIGGYSIKQYKATDNTFGDAVAVWDSHSGIKLMRSKINWSPFYVSETSSGVPESVCSKPCGEREYYQKKELRCCWECIRCRNNERLNENRTACQECPITYWPDTETSCDPIPPTYVRWKESTAIALSSISAVCLLTTTVVAALYIYHRSNKLIKATSRELSGLELIGIAFAFLTVFAILCKPTRASCILACYGFAVSVCLIYAPLLVKTIRIYRIFAAGRKGLKKPGFIGMKSQLVFCALLLVFQIVICIITGVLVPTEAKLRMHVLTTRFVELYCDLTLQTMLGFLIYNLVLISGCGILGFLTRKLPQNFNESWYIFVSVSTTIFVWIVFLPTYFSSFYASRQTVLLALCLILNAGVTLLCQYVPKIYAIYFVDEEKLVFVNNTQGTSSTMATSHGRSSRVVPSSSFENHTGNDH